MEYRSTKGTRFFSPPTPSMMDRWNDLKAKLKKKYPSLTDNDLLYKEGKKNEMFERLRIKLEINKEDWMKIMKEI